MKKKTGKPPIVKLLMFTAFTILVWIGFEVYRALTLESDPIVGPEILAPINPTLDQTTLHTLPQRLFLDDSAIGDTIILSRPSSTTNTVEEPEPVPNENEETENESE